MRAQPLGLRSGDRELLESWTRSSSIRAGLARRARIVLLAADGVSNTDIAERVGVSRPTVISTVSAAGDLPELYRFCAGARWRRSGCIGSISYVVGRLSLSR